MRRLPLILAFIFVSSVGNEFYAQASKRPRRSTARPTQPAKQRERDELDDLLDFETEDLTADRWVLLLISKDLLAYYNPARVTRPTDRTVQAWFKRKDAIPSRKNLGEFDGKTITEELMLMEFKCSERRDRILSVIWYGSDGGVLASTEPQNPEWTYVVPDSVGEKQMEKACAIAANLKR